MPDLLKQFPKTQIYVITSKAFFALRGDPVFLGFSIASSLRSQ